MLKWIKKLLRVVKDYDSDRRNTNLQIAEAIKIIRERTTVDVDVALTSRDANQIIVSGIYRGRIYVQTYSIYTDDFADIIRLLRQMKQYGTVRRVDCPYTMKAVIDSELKF